MMPLPVRHRRWLESVRARRPLTQEGISALELGMSWRLRRRTREFARFLEGVIFGGPGPEAILTGLTPPRFPEVSGRRFTLAGHDFFRRAGAARLAAEKRGWKP